SGPRMGDSLVWLAAFGALEQPEARGPFLVGVLAVVLADVLDDLVIRHAPVRERHRPGLLEHLRILDRDLVPEDVRPHEPEALGEAQPGRVRTDILWDEITIEDPEMLEKPWTVTF